MAQLQPDDCEEEGVRMSLFMTQKNSGRNGIDIHHGAHGFWLPTA